MSRKGNCLDNAPMESFFGSLKTELVHRTRFVPGARPGLRYSSTSRSSITNDGATRASATGRWHGAEAVRDAIARTITTLPAQLRRSLTWDQGAEMARHADLRIATGLPVYFCEPHSPWQRGTNENTNGLLRQYFPKGTDLSAHSPDVLAVVADALNTRPRKTLGWRTPAEALDQCLQASQTERVATTG